MILRRPARLLRRPVWAAFAVFAVGYTLGPGGLAKLLAAGAYAWSGALVAVALAGLLFGAVLESADRATEAVGGSLLGAFRTRLPAGSAIGLLVILGVFLAQGSGLPVLVSHVARLLWFELEELVPILQPYGPLGPAALAAVGLGCAAGLLWTGNLGRIMPVMALLVAVMAAGLAGTLASVLLEDPVAFTATTRSACLQGETMLPLLGIGLATPTILLWPQLMRRREWSAPHARFAAWAAAAALTVLSGSAAAVGAALPGPTDHVPDEMMAMVQTWRKVAGSAASRWFALAALGAGLSSILPMLIILPKLMEDYGGGIPLRPAWYRGWLLSACALGMMGPLGGEWVRDGHHLLGQIAQLFLPVLVVAGLCMLLRTERPGPWLYAGLLTALGVTVLAAAKAFRHLAVNFD